MMRVNYFAGYIMWQNIIKRNMCAMVHTDAFYSVDFLKFKIKIILKIIFPFLLYFQVAAVSRNHTKRIREDRR